MENRQAVPGRRKFLLATGTLALVGTLGHGSAQGGEFPDGASLVTRCTQSGEPCIKYTVGTDQQPFTDLAVAARKTAVSAMAVIDYFNNGVALDEHELNEGMALAAAVVAGCEAVIDLSLNQSPYLSSFVSPTVEVCMACQNFCSRLNGHQACIDCAQACRELIGSWQQMTETIEYEL